MLKYIEQFIDKYLLRKNILTFDTNMYGDECPICLDIFETTDDINTLCTLKCNHSYHTICIKNWMKKDKSCPTCRTNM